MAGKLGKYAHAFRLWLHRDARRYQMYLNVYGEYEPERLAFEALLALAED